jgi:hypothetical protein
MAGDIERAAWRRETPRVAGGHDGLVAEADGGQDDGQRHHRERAAFDDGPHGRARQCAARGRATPTGTTRSDSCARRRRSSHAAAMP